MRVQLQFTVLEQVLLGALYVFKREDLPQPSPAPWDGNQPEQKVEVPGALAQQAPRALGDSWQ